VTEEQQLRAGVADRTARARSAVVRSAFARPAAGTTTTTLIWGPPAPRAAAPIDITPIDDTPGGPRRASRDAARPIDITPGAAPAARRGAAAPITMAPPHAAAPIDITPGRLGAATAGDGGRRRWRAGLMAVAAAGALVAGGAAYAALAPGGPAGAPGAGPRLSRPAVPAAVLPTAGPTAAARPGSVAASSRVAPASRRFRSPARRFGSPTAPATPAVPSNPPADAEPRTPQSPPSLPGYPPVPVRTTAPPAPGPLSATTGWDPDTRTGFVRLENPGGRAVGDWRVRLDFPGGAPVTSDDATVTQHGRHVELSAGRPVPAGGSRTVHFAAPEPPDGCTIGGHPCG
jgi:hypothetical protein